MSSRNKLMIASAGAGKTTYLVDKSLNILEKNNKATVLITTYTRSNAEQIRVKIKEENAKRNGLYSIPSRIVVQEWYTLLLGEGVRPFKSLMDERLKYRSIRLLPDFQYNENIYKSPKEVMKHYFVGNYIIPNALSEFVFNANKKTEGEVIRRLSDIYSYIFIDEVQDLAGYDLELIRELIKSPINILMVGDPRQVTYLTNQPKLNRQYKDGKIEKYIKDKCANLDVEIDVNTLKKSHRNNLQICNFSSMMYPQFDKSEPCDCLKCRILKTDTGVFLIKKSDIEKCKDKYKTENIGVLKWQNAVFPEKNYGDSKGATYDRVFIHPTKTIIDYLHTGQLKKEEKHRITGKIEIKNALDIPKFYVALTRARHSVFIVHDYKENETFISGVKLY